MRLTRVTTGIVISNDAMERSITTITTRITTGIATGITTANITGSITKNIACTTSGKTIDITNGTTTGITTDISTGSSTGWLATVGLYLNTVLFFDFATISVFAHLQRSRVKHNGSMRVLVLWMLLLLPQVCLG